MRKYRHSKHSTHRNRCMNLDQRASEWTSANILKVKCVSALRCVSINKISIAGKCNRLENCIEHPISSGAPLALLIWKCGSASTDRSYRVALTLAPRFLFAYARFCSVLYIWILNNNIDQFISLPFFFPHRAIHVLICRMVACAIPAFIICKFVAQLIGFWKCFASRISPMVDGR